jgi:hypothetical protein
VDFYRIVTSEPDKKGVISVFPDYTPIGFSDLMIRGGSFYAIWDEEKNTWSTNEYDVVRLVDQDIYRAVEELPPPEAGRYSIKFMNAFSSSSWIKFKSFINSVSDRYEPLDRKLVFLDDVTTKTDYVTKSLPYKLEKGSHDAWDELLSTLYSPIERQKIEWAIGSVVAGDSRFIQKFPVPESLLSLTSSRSCSKDISQPSKLRLSAVTTERSQRPHSSITRLWRSSMMETCPVSRTTPS